MTANPFEQDAGTAQVADFPSGSKAGAVVLSFFVPFVSLIVALVLRSSETIPVRRASLRTWAIASACWLAFGVLIIAIIVIASAAPKVSSIQPSSNGPCLGGPSSGAAGTPVGNGNYRFACSLGGSTIEHFGN